MKDRIEYKETIEVPKGTGRAGFILAIEQVLKLSRVQDIHIDARGKVSYTRFVAEGEEVAPLRVDFESVSPYAVIRNSEVVETSYPDDVNAAVAVSLLFQEVSVDQLFPIAFVGGMKTDIWRWMFNSTGVTPPKIRDELFGLPLYQDRMIEDYMLVLCAGYSRNAAMLDTQKSYKIVIPLQPPEPK